MNNPVVYKPKDFAKLTGVTVKTLQRWDNSGKLKAFRTPTNKRYYTYDQYLEFKGEKRSGEKEAVIYTRVSTRNQSDDLKNQALFLQQFCSAKGIVVERVIKDYGSGLNYKREKWNELLGDVIDGRVGTIIIASKDRFVRFGYEWFEAFCKRFGTDIIVVNNETMSPNEELVQDIISILHVFSCRLYGLRKYKDKIRGDEQIVKELQDGDRSDGNTSLDNS